MRYRSVLMSVAALALPPIAVADAQSVYVAPGGVYVASGNVYVTPAPGPFAAPAPGIADPTSAYPPPYGAPATVYAIAAFDLIRYRRNGVCVFLNAFDLIELNGDDLRRDPLVVRKATLA